MKNPKYLHYVPKRIGIFGLCILASCSTKTETLFTPLPVGAAGIGFQNTLTEGGPINILDYLYFYNGGGTAMGDINNDGLPDLFFSANQKPNGLYLNKGNLTFENITKKAGVQGNSSWNTAAVMADVNADGWLDIYVTAVVGIHGFTGHNELYINNKDNTFTEMAAAHGLDIQAFCTTANFFDYDLDGDLDLFLLNHAVHTEGSFGKASLREKRDKKTGDRLLRNDNGHFNDVSIAAGIYGGINGYGLGLSVADFNSDGYPDIYVGNDFHEDDYYYINNGNGTFTNKIKQFFGHTSRFSMGNDVADINHDGRPDLISLDMLPEDETVLKSSEGDDTYQTLQMRTQQYGYHYQYSRNMLFLNGGGNPFSETALLAGVAATDWSWSALFGDYDQDGEQDLFISNGIPKRPNNSDFVRFVSNGKIKATMNKTRLVDRQALQMMPSGAVHNYYFKGNGDGSFNNISQKAIPNSKTVSGATAVGDLDNDGDLDIVTNNLNGPPGIYINNTNTSARFLKLKFNSSAKNPFGIGTKAFVYHNGKLQFKQLFPNRGWQASSEPMLHFGLGTVEVIDSVKIIW
ncbi:MAG: CRTAC1 family protein, partial [Marinirhabdus sp.]